MVALQAVLVLLAVATAHAQTALPIKAIGPTLVEIKVGDGQATSYEMPALLIVHKTQMIVQQPM